MPWEFSNQYGYGMDCAQDLEAPQTVVAVPRLFHDCKALLRLTQVEDPPAYQVLCARVVDVFYGFGDASGSGFGATFEIKGDIIYEYGQWTTEESEGSSSNWRELKNLVDSLTRFLRLVPPGGCEVFIFTDNAVAERAYWKGTSHNEKLADLVLELKETEQREDIRLHVIHVSGKRMIAQGSDGISRGDHSEGVMQGRPMIEYAPLHLRADEEDPSLKKLVSDILGDFPFKTLTPEGWFEEGQTSGSFVWYG